MSAGGGAATAGPAAATQRLVALRAKGKAGLAAALARLETHPEAPDTLALLEAAWRAPRAQVIGITGPPGVGKSTLLGALIPLLRGQGRSLAVIAVDPSSRRSGGALLGDRLRLRSDPEDEGLFIRSMAARDRLGGLAEITWCAAVLFRALFDLVLIETVGVGQSEADVAAVADTTVLCLQPGSGDSLQFMKAGILELPDIAIVTKADMGAPAERTLADLEWALSISGAAAAGSWKLRRLALSVERGEGLTELLAAIETHRQWLEESGRLLGRRRQQAETWLAETLRDRFGREGLARAASLALGPGEAPFARLAELSASLRA